MLNETPHNPLDAIVSVWTKGFRISEDSDEFQRIVPAKDDFLLTLEGELHKFKSWPSVLEPLYGLPNHELSNQRCMLVRSDEIGMMAAERYEDKHGRPNLVIVLATSRIDWRDHELGKNIARLSNLTGRLSTHFAATFRRNPAEIQTQLRASTFLTDRKFNITEEPTGATTDWAMVIESVRKWKGVQGVSTAKLATLGANVVLGTRSEAERAGAKIDGYIDTRNFQIIPLSSALTPWAKPEENLPAKSTPIEPILPPNPPQPSYEYLVSIDKSLDEINKSITRIADVVLDLSDGVLRLLSGNYRRPK
ncbi:hypothetical protein KH5H1_08060 [Corallococcus caeni]|uniref:hypothetical protein n=1 Tax=Corallococcus caeni TaxID=3082388 RepID=UPI002956AE5B|nr:hypothetical protein KH5H1_08060 [Corallococcus sp. KH5-1]